MEINVFEKEGAIIVAQVMYSNEDGWGVKNPKLVQAYPHRNEQTQKAELNIQLLPLVYEALLEDPARGFRVAYKVGTYQDVTSQFSNSIPDLYSTLEESKEKKNEADTESQIVTS
jgi:hypothetical protein